MNERTAALRDLEAGRVNVVFTVDLFNEGVDVPNVDTLLLLRPTESPTLFLQQLGRGLRRARGKALCTVLDFVGNHRREFRFDRRLRALLGGSRRDVEHQVETDFPFLPAGCHMELDPIAREIVLRSIREAIPSDWKARREELRSLGDVSLATYLEETALELEDVYASNHSWSELRRVVALPTDSAGPQEGALLRAVGRLLHVDDRERLNAYRSLIEQGSAPDPSLLSNHERRVARMLIGSLTTSRTSATLAEGLAELWNHPQVRNELLEVLDILPERIDHLHEPLGIANVPLAVHARYTRTEILAAFDVGAGAKPTTWQSGVWWDENSQSDLFAFTLDKSSGSFSPTTRYRDYAISPDLIHWESQSATSLDSDTGRRYLSQAQRGTNIVLFRRGSGQPTEHSGASVRRPTSRTKANARSRSRGGSITAFPATSSPSSRPPSPRYRIELRPQQALDSGTADRRAPYSFAMVVSPEIGAAPGGEMSGEQRGLNPTDQARLGESMAEVFAKARARLTSAT